MSEKMETMHKRVFLTHRAAPLPGWLKAFPDADVSRFPTEGEAVARRSGMQLVWVHVNKTEDVVALSNKAALMYPGALIVVLANIPKDEEALAALGAGASGYVSALAVPELLQQVAMVVESGGLWVGPGVVQRFMSAIGSRPGWKNDSRILDRLSPRQREVAVAVCSGASNKEIARQLGITERTVKAHLSAVLDFYGVRDRLQLSLLVNTSNLPTRR